MTFTYYRRVSFIKAPQFPCCVSEQHGRLDVSLRSLYHAREGVGHVAQLASQSGDRSAGSSSFFRVGGIGLRDCVHLTDCTIELGNAFSLFDLIMAFDLSAEFLIAAMA